MISDLCIVISGAQNLLFGMPIAATLAHMGTIENSRGIWEHKKGDLGVQAWIPIDFGWIPDRILKVLGNF